MLKVQFYLTEKAATNEKESFLKIFSQFMAKYLVGRWREKRDKPRTAGTLRVISGTGPLKFFQQWVTT